MKRIDHPDRPQPSVQVDCSQGGRTQQSFTDECNINSIMQRFQKTKTLTHIRDSLPTYADFADAQSYEESMKVIASANSSFQELPANIRERFENDPGQFVDFIDELGENDMHEEEAADMGLIDKNAFLLRMKEKAKAMKIAEDADFQKKYKAQAKSVPDGTVQGGD